jgi:hypothetical protein
VQLGVGPVHQGAVQPDRAGPLIEGKHLISPRS